MAQKLILGSPNMEVLTPSDLSGVATEEKQDAAKAVLDSVAADVAALKRQATPLGPVHYRIAKEAGGGGYDLTWHDPSDTIIYGVPAAFWARTVIMARDDGEYPTSPTDSSARVVVTSTIRNQYLHTPFNDEDGTSSTRYRAFPYATSGFYNESETNNFPATPVWIFGYTIDTQDNNPATMITYTDDNTDFAPLSMDFANNVLDWGDWQTWCEDNFKPAMLTYGGEIDYYLNPNNLAEKMDGSASDVASLSYGGNAMNIVKPIFYNVTQDGAIQHYRFSNVQQGADWYCWTHLKSDGTFAPFCGWPLFEGTYSNSVLRSIATGAKPGGNVNQTTEYTYATNNGANWYCTTAADEFMFRMLFPLICRNTNSQAVIGGSYVSGASALQINCGSMKDKGAFWGMEFDGSANVTTGTKFLNMENMWCHRWRRPVGINHYSGFVYIKLTPSMADGSKTDHFLTNDNDDFLGKYIAPGLAVPYIQTSPQYITVMSSSPLAPMLPAVCNGSSTTGFCDVMYYTYGAGARVLACGGYVTAGLGAGAFASSLSSAPSSSSWNSGSSPSYHTF